MLWLLLLEEDVTHRKMHCSANIDSRYSKLVFLLKNHQRKNILNLQVYMLLIQHNHTFTYSCIHVNNVRRTGKYLFKKKKQFILAPENFTSVCMNCARYQFLIKISTSFGEFFWLQRRSALCSNELATDRFWQWEWFELKSKSRFVWVCFR